MEECSAYAQAQARDLCVYDCVCVHIYIYTIIYVYVYTKRINGCQFLKAQVMLLVRC